MTESIIMQEFLASLGHEQTLAQEFQRMIEERGLDPQRMTLDDIRELVAAYARKVLLEAKHTVAS